MVSVVESVFILLEVFFLIVGVYLWYLKQIDGLYLWFLKQIEQTIAENKQFIEKIKLEHRRAMEKGVLIVAIHLWHQKKNELILVETQHALESEKAKHKQTIAENKQSIERLIDNMKERHEREMAELNEVKRIQSDESIVTSTTTNALEERDSIETPRLEVQEGQDEQQQVLKHNEKLDCANFIW
jgi:hypothetical protein